MHSQNQVKKSNILIVDDLEANLVAMVEALEGIDANFLTATSGEKALKLMTNNDFAVVLMDVQMPCMGGFETAELMKKNKRTRGIPIIFVTAISKEQQYVFKGYEAGAVDYLFKPIETHILKSKIQIFLNLYQQKNMQILQTVSELRVVKNELKEKNEALSKLALYDPLTTVSNRRQFEADLEKQVALANRHSNEKFAVIFLDLDNFKSINDSLGHQIGDQLLQYIGKVLIQNTRKEDYQARLGGDEFAIIVTHIKHSSDAGKTANQIKSMLEHIIELDTHSIETSFSMGIACYPDAGKTAQSLMHSADIAMYHAKAMGKKQICYFTDELQQAYLKRLEVESLVKDAINQNAFELTYQPIFNLSTNKPFAIEAQLYCKHPKLQDKNVKYLIRIAEALGLAEALSERVMNQYISQIKCWFNQASKHLFYVIHIPNSQLFHKHFFKQIKEITSCDNFPKDKLVFELNETVLANCDNHSNSVLHQLHKHGIQFIIDDFGCGHSSLTHLNELPIYALKINSFFIEKTIQDIKYDRLNKAIISIAKNLNLEVIAEGVQTDQQLLFLKDNHCLFAQGKLFTPPLPATEMTKLLEAYNDAS